MNLSKGDRKKHKTNNPISQVTRRIDSDTPDANARNNKFGTQLLAQLPPVNQHLPIEEKENIMKALETRHCTTTIV